MNKQKGFTPVLILVGILVIAGVISGAYYVGTKKNTVSSSVPKACTQEAKQCPDGSFIGRTGPNCEFSPCPSAAPKAQDETANWKTYTNQQGFYSFKYPAIATAQKDTVFLSDHPGLVDNLLIKLPKDPAVQSDYDNSIIVWKNLGVKIIDVASRDVWCKLLMDKFPESQYSCVPSRSDFLYGEVIVNEYKAFKPISPNLKPGMERYFIPHGNYVYEINLITVKTVKIGDGYGSSDDTIPNQILSTFKFN